MGDTVAVMSMPYLLGVVGGETREGVFTNAPSVVQSLDAAVADGH